jgi:hypothetical protein
MNEPLHTWHDSTTYSRDDKQRVPSSWSYKTEKLKITVVNKHRDYPDRWIMHCYDIGMNTVVLKAPIETPVDEIQAAAIRVVKRRLSEMIKSFVTIKNTPEQ